MQKYANFEAESTKTWTQFHIAAFKEVIILHRKMLSNNEQDTSHRLYIMGFWLVAMF